MPFKKTSMQSVLYIRCRIRCPIVLIFVAIKFGNFAFSCSITILPGAYKTFLQSRTQPQAFSLVEPRAKPRHIQLYCLSLSLRLVNSFITSDAWSEIWEEFYNLRRRVSSSRPVLPFRQLFFLFLKNRNSQLGVDLASKAYKQLRAWISNITVNIKWRIRDSKYVIRNLAESTLNDE